MEEYKVNIQIPDELRNKPKEMKSLVLNAMGIVLASFNSAGGMTFDNKQEYVKPLFYTTSGLVTGEPMVPQFSENISEMAEEGNLPGIIEATFRAAVNQYVTNMKEEGHTPTITGSGAIYLKDVQVKTFSGDTFNLNFMMLFPDSITGFTFVPKSLKLTKAPDLPLFQNP